MSSSEDSFARLRAAIAELPADFTALTALDDSEVEQWLRGLAQAHRAIAATMGLFAGEVAHRSRRELGYAGLAQRTGFRTAAAFVQNATQSTIRDATALVHVGTLLLEAFTERTPLGGDAPATTTDTGGDADTDQARPQPSLSPDGWRSPVAHAVSTGDLSVDGAVAITRTLDPERLTEEQLAVAVTDLLDAAGSLNDDELLRRARDLVNDLDEAGIAEREKLIHEERAIRRVKRPNGLPRYIVDPDIEAAAIWDGVYDRMTSPRRSPRFSDLSDDLADASARVPASDDDRSPAQLAHDGFTELVRIGAGADPSVLGRVQPAVRALVTATQLANRRGHGYIEGQPVPVSIETIERLACSNGTVPLVFSEKGQALDLGRTSRLHSGPQRILIGVRDGGCMCGGCDRPVSWSEVHHIKHWVRDHGETNLEDAVLLCRHHHLLVHNNGWEVVREGESYWLVPPPEIDRRQIRRPMKSKSPVLRDLMREQASEASAELVTT